MRRNTSRKRLAMWGALPPYLGGKRRLCPLIFREIDHVLPRRMWAGRMFLDGFLGGGSVSLYAKAQGFRVVSCDIAERALMTGRGLIENSRTKISREDVIRILTPNPEPALRIEREMCPAIFTQNVARFIDRALVQAELTPDPAKAALLKLLAIRMALLSHPMSQVRKGTIHRVTTGEFESITQSCIKRYVDDALRLTRLERVWELAEHINAGVFQGDGTVHEGSVLDLLPTIDADVAYFDPPYPGVMSYEREYKVIDEILEGKTRPTSPFTAKDGAAMIDRLFERAQHIPVWLLSLGNAVAALDELEAKMTKLGRATKAIEIRYQHLAAIATDEKKEANREFLVVGWDPTAPVLAGLPLPRRESEVEQFLLAGAPDADFLRDQDLLRSEAAPALALLDHTDDQGPLGLRDQSLSGDGIHHLAVDESDVHEPVPGLVKRAIDESDVVRRSLPEGHPASVSPFAPDVNS
jgi:adenine-specific DNA methylase